MPVLVRRRSRLVLATGAGYAVLAATTQPLTTPAALAVAIPAAVVVVLVVRPRPERDGLGADEPADADGPAGAARRRTAGAWGAVVGILVVAEVVALSRQPALDVASADAPTLSGLLDPVTEQAPFRFAAWCCWLAVGWALVTR